MGQPGDRRTANGDQPLVVIEVPPLPGPRAVVGPPSDDSLTTCPNCRHPGHVDMVDLVNRTAHSSCATCGAMWRTYGAAVTQRGAPTRDVRAYGSPPGSMYWTRSTCSTSSSEHTSTPALREASAVVPSPGTRRRVNEPS